MRAAGSPGTAGAKYRIPPRQGRHRAPLVVVDHDRWSWPVAVGAAAVGLAGLTGAAVSAAPHAEPPASVALPSEAPDYPSARGADIVPGPLKLPTIVPTDAPVWAPVKGRVIVNGKPLPAPVVPAQASAPAVESSPAPPNMPTAAAATAPPVGVPDPTPPADPQPQPTPIASPIPDPPAQPTATDPATTPTGTPTLEPAP